MIFYFIEVQVLLINSVTLQMNYYASVNMSMLPPSILQFASTEIPCKCCVTEITLLLKGFLVQKARLPENSNCLNATTQGLL